MQSKILCFVEKIIVYAKVTVFIFIDANNVTNTH